MSLENNNHRLDKLELLDIEALRLILLGSSVIDWLRLAFKDREQIDRFLRLCRFDPESPYDQMWMRGILADAVAYLRESFNYVVPPQVEHPAEVHDLFLFASGVREPQHRKIACIALKLCHVIMHIEARDLFHRLPMSEEAFGEMAQAHVMGTLRRIKDEGFAIEEARASAKSRNSLISKLLHKSDTLAANIYDRTRFRVTVAEREDILPVLHRLTQELFPFHLVVPGQTQNSLIDFDEVCRKTSAWAPLLPSLQFGVGFLSDPNGRDSNEFSSADYKILKFVVDLPLRIGDHLISRDVAASTRARTVCCLVEIQVVDATTAAFNEKGESDHKQYKERQRLLVQHRLSRGLAASFTRPKPD